MNYYVSKDQGKYNICCIVIIIISNDLSGTEMWFQTGPALHNLHRNVLHGHRPLLPHPSGALRHSHQYKGRRQNKTCFSKGPCPKSVNPPSPPSIPLRTPKVTFHQKWLFKVKNTIRDGGTTSPYTHGTVETVDTVDMVYTVGMVYTSILLTLFTMLTCGLRGQRGWGGCGGWGG